MECFDNNHQLFQFVHLLDLLPDHLQYRILDHLLGHPLKNHLLGHPLKNHLFYCIFSVFLVFSFLKKVHHLLQYYSVILTYCFRLHLQVQRFISSIFILLFDVPSRLFLNLFEELLHWRKKKILKHGLISQFWMNKKNINYKYLNNYLIFFLKCFKSNFI